VVGGVAVEEGATVATPHRLTLIIATTKVEVDFIPGIQPAVHASLIRTS